MPDQGVKLNAEQRDICEQCNLVVEIDGDDVVVTDKDPALIAKAKKAKKGPKFPQYAGARENLTALINQARTAQEKRNGGKVIDFPEPVVEVAPEPVVEVIPEPVVEEVPEAPVAPKPPLRRAVITEADQAPPDVLTDVVLDESNKKVRPIKTPKPKQDNRYARAFRALLENPDASVEEQARIADVTVPMFIWYDITFRHMYRIIYEKHGEGCIPPLPKLKK
jgi:hypothetical protein